eukprot:COSAG06_NODE_797_length_12213_cov_7.037382_10_plen_96_part_00
MLAGWLGHQPGFTHFCAAGWPRHATAQPDDARKHHARSRAPGSVHAEEQAGAGRAQQHLTNYGKGAHPFFASGDLQAWALQFGRINYRTVEYGIM